MAEKRYDCIVIGGGAVGALTARALTASGASVLLLEAGADLASGATRANSAIIHAGFDPKPGTKKAACNVRGAALYPELAKILDIPFRPLDSLVVAYSEADLATLETLYERGQANGVPSMRLLSRAETHEKEPNLSETACGALCAAAAIIEPWTVAVAAAENACDNGAEARFERRVSAIERTSDGFIVTSQTPDGEETDRASVVVNAAGVHADDIHAMLAPKTYHITGKRGQYVVLDRSAAGLVSHVLFACPTEKGKGVLITPEIHGRIMIGPDSTVCDDKDDIGTTAAALAYVKEAASRYLSVRLPLNLQIRTFAGVRPAGDTGDFVIGEAADIPGFFEAACIESPGLASAPAIAETLAESIAQKLMLRPRTSFVPVRRPRPQPDADGTGAETTLVCRCEQITEAQIVDAIHRNCGARSLKGVKLRTGAMLGGCQGGFCSPRIVRILARELQIDPGQVRYDGTGSEILTGKTRG